MTVRIDATKQVPLAAIVHGVAIVLDLFEGAAVDDGLVRQSLHIERVAEDIWESTVRYADDEDAAAKAIVKKPVAVYIERVYQEGTFGGLQGVLVAPLCRPAQQRLAQRCRVPRRTLEMATQSLLSGMGMG